MFESAGDKKNCKLRVLEGNFCQMCKNWKQLKLETEEDIGRGFYYYSSPSGSFLYEFMNF